MRSVRAVCVVPIILGAALLARDRGPEPAGARFCVGTPAPACPRLLQAAGDPSGSGAADFAFDPVVLASGFALIVGSRDHGTITDSLTPAYRTESNLHSGRAPPAA